jgi:hypothetical protein
VLRKTSLVAAEILWDIEALLGRQDLDHLDLEALEMAVRRQVLALATIAVQQRLNADHSDDEPAQRPCPCGASARYASRSSKTFQSILRPLELERAYYHCQLVPAASVSATSNWICSIPPYHPLSHA